MFLGLSFISAGIEAFSTNSAAIINLILSDRTCKVPFVLLDVGVSIDWPAALSYLRPLSWVDLL